MTAILEMHSMYVAYLKNTAYGFIKLSAKFYNFNILCTMHVLSCLTMKAVYGIKKVPQTGYRTIFGSIENIFLELI